MNWYYFSEGREVGPLSVTALGEIRASGGIADETPVRREDSAEWEAYSTAFHPKLETQQDVNPSADKPAFKFECPHCQQHISTDEDYSGKTVQCPTCGGEFVVPQAPEKIEATKLDSEVTHEVQEPEMPTLQEPALTSPPQTPGTSNPFGERVNGGSITSNKGRGKSKVQVTAVAAAILIAVAVGALLIPKTKSDEPVVKEYVPELDQSDRTNESDVTVNKKQHDDEASGPTLDLAKYARESVERDADKGYDYYDSKATYERLKRQQMVANGLKKKGMLNDDTEMFTVIILAIVNTDWSKCSPRLRERADKVKTTFELVGKKRATYDDLADSVKSLNEITDEVSKSASKNPMFVKNLPNIISDLEKDIYGDKTLEMQNKGEQETSIDNSDGEVSLKFWPPTWKEPITISNYREGDKLRDAQLADNMFLRVYLIGLNYPEKIEGFANKFKDYKFDEKISYESRLISIAKLGAQDAAHGATNKRLLVLENSEDQNKIVGLSRLEILEKYFGSKESWDKKHGFTAESMRIEQEQEIQYEGILVGDFWLRFQDYLDSEQEAPTRESTQQDSIIGTPDTIEKSNTPPLVALESFKNFTIEEAKECVRLLDEELGKNPGNERASAVKAAIMDVFKAEASLIAAASGTKDADEQYRIKMQNLQLASRPSPLTGKVNTTEVERIRREAEAIKTGSESRVRNAKSALKRSIEEARRSAPAPDREALSRVWDQIERRNNL